MFGNDIESLRIACGTIFSEVVGWEFICQNGDQHGRKLNENRKHIRRGEWRCLCNSIFSFLVVAEFNSAIYRLHIDAEGLEKTVALGSFSNRKESFAPSIPRSSGYGRPMDSRTARISADLLVSIIGMDLYSKYSASASSNRCEVWILGGDGKVGMTIVHLVGSEWKIGIKFTFTWPVEKDRRLLRIYWCKLPEAKIFFTTDPRYVSCLGKIIMCLDASFDEESRLYVGKLHEEMPMLQESFEVSVADCSQLRQRKPFFKLSEVVLEFGNRMNGGIEQALHKIELLVPVQTLERRLVRRDNRPATQVLVHWANSFPEDATWEYLHDIQERFPHFNLEDKVI